MLTGSEFTVLEFKIFVWGFRLTAFGPIGVGLASSGEGVLPSLTWIP